MQCITGGAMTVILCAGRESHGVLATSRKVRSKRKHNNIIIYYR